MRTWLKNQLPAIYIFLILSLGFILVILAKYFDSTGASFSIISPILSGLGGTFIGGGIATIFLNLPNTRKYISSTIANLFATGEIINSLSPEHRAFLKKSIIAKEINNK